MNFETLIDLLPFAFGLAAWVVCGWIEAVAEFCERLTEERD